MFFSIYDIQIIYHIKENDINILLILYEKEQLYLILVYIEKLQIP